MNESSQIEITDQSIQNLLMDKQKFHYPFGEKVKDHFKGKYSIPLFTYGSLLNKESALRSMKAEVYEARVPSVTFGFKRIFNRDVDVTDSPRYVTPQDKNERGMLNLFSTNNNADIVNGFVFDLNLAGIGAMCAREVGYDLVPCVVMPWDNYKTGDVKDAQLQVVYTFLAPSEERVGIYPVRDDITPIKEYFDLVKHGAAQYGQDFLDHWYATTVLADGQTTATQWEKQLTKT